MKRIKLFTALLLAAAMVLPMAGCGKGKPKDGGEASPASCAAAGEYEVYSMTTAGTTLTRSQLEAGGMAEGMFLKINADGESFYPLYDNGRSLFYEDTESFARKAAADPRAFATTFGYVGTYWDHARDIAAKGVRFGDLLNLDVDPRTIRALLVEAGFTDYRLEAATEWIANAMECLKSLG